MHRGGGIFGHFGQGSLSANAHFFASYASFSAWSLGIAAEETARGH
jgi:hypothetical protein